MNDLERPLFSLTVGEFIELQKYEKAIQPCMPEKADKKYVYGIHGLAKLLNCSNPTAQKIKNSGDIKFIQSGRKIIFDADSVLRDLEAKKKGRRS